MLCNEAMVFPCESWFAEIGIRFWEKADDANPKCKLQNWTFARVSAKSSMAMAEPKNKRKVICGGHQT